MVVFPVKDKLETTVSLMGEERSGSMGRTGAAMLTERSLNVD